MGSSTLRFPILVAAVVIGVLVISNAFQTPGGSNAAVTSPSPTPPPHKPKPKPSPQVQGVTIAVFNGTSVVNAAGKWENKLTTQAGYVAKQRAGNAPTQVATTSVYFVTNNQKVNAQGLANTFFPGATVSKVPSTLPVSAGVDIAIVVGADHASS